MGHRAAKSSGSTATHLRTGGLIKARERDTSDLGSEVKGGAMSWQEEAQCPLWGLMSLWKGVRTRRGLGVTEGERWRQHGIPVPGQAPFGPWPGPRFREQNSLD